MLQYIQNSGLVGLVILVLGLTCVVQLARGLTGKAERKGTGRSLLFFGILAVLLGFLGYTIGSFTALGVILEAEVIDPELVQQAMWICLSTVFMGFGVLAVALVGWAALRLGGGPEPAPE